MLTLPNADGNDESEMCPKLVPCACSAEIFGIIPFLFRPCSALTNKFNGITALHRRMLFR